MACFAAVRDGDSFHDAVSDRELTMRAVDTVNLATPPSRTAPPEEDVHVDMAVQMAAMLRGMETMKVQQVQFMQSMQGAHEQLAQSHVQLAARLEARLQSPQEAPPLRHHELPGLRTSAVDSPRAVIEHHLTGAASTSSSSASAGPTSILRTSSVQVAHEQLQARMEARLASTQTALEVRVASTQTALQLQHHELQGLRTPARAVSPPGASFPEFWPPHSQLCRSEGTCAATAVSSPGTSFPEFWPARACITSFPSTGWTDVLPVRSPGLLRSPRAHDTGVGRGGAWVHQSIEGSSSDDDAHDYDHSSAVSGLAAHTSDQLASLHVCNVESGSGGVSAGSPGGDVPVRNPTSIGEDDARGGEGSAFASTGPDQETESEGESDASDASGGRWWCSCGDCDACEDGYHELCEWAEECGDDWEWRPCDPGDGGRVFYESSCSDESESSDDGR